MTKKVGSRIQDRDPHQNTMDPKHCFLAYYSLFPIEMKILDTDLDQLT